MNKTQKTGKKQKKKKIIIAALAVGATGVLGYFGWQYLKRKKQAGKQDMTSLMSKINEPVNTEPAVPSKPTRASKKINNRTADTIPINEFPLKKGTKGQYVQKLQEAIIVKYGAATLAQYGADGDFGTELYNALKKLGLPTTISQSAFNVITQGIETTDPAAIGTALYKAASSNDFNKTISLLKKLGSPNDYAIAGERFKQYRLGGIRQTLVNGLLSIAGSEAQKQQLRNEFLRIGLQFDGNKWSLSGTDDQAIVTTLPTKVWINARQSVQVPARMVLGSAVSKRLDYTLFENKGKYFLVQSRHVKSL